MELRHLRYLVAIADAGTFTRAAEQLRVAQPALTRQIHDLERELGAELFDSRARKATLTLAGEACVRLARHVMQDTERAVQRARLSNKGLAGSVVIATGQVPLQAGFVGRVMTRLRSRHTGIAVTIQELAMEDQWDALARGEADIGFGVVPNEHYPMLAAETQYVDVIDAVVVAPEHPLARHESLSLDELSRHQVLVLDSTDRVILEVFRRLRGELVARGVPDDAPRRFPSLESMLAHVRAGQGWAPMAHGMIEALPSFVAIPMSDFRAPYPVSRLWRRADDRPVIRTVLRELQQMEQEAREDTTATTVPDADAQKYLPARLELRHLRSFSDLARHGSMGRAAELLGITQPALSRQMRDLEYDAGVDLLERGTRGVELTITGKLFLGDVNSILSVTDHFVKEVQRAKRGAAQRCVMGVVPHPHIDALIVKAIAKLEAGTPRIRAGTREIGTPFQPEALLRSQVDVAIGFLYPTRIAQSEELTRVRLFHDELSYALLSKKHPLASRASLALVDLAHIPFIFASRETFPAVYDVVMHQFDLAGVRPRIESEFPGVRTIWSMTAQGVGWALGLREQAHIPPPGTVAIPLQDFRLPWGAELIYRKDEARAAILTAIDVIVDYARQLFPDISPEIAKLPSGDTSGTAIS